MSIHKISRPLKNGTRSTRYRVFIQINPAKQITKSFKRKIDADAWEVKQKHLWKLGESTLVSESSEMTVKGLSEYWLENYAKLNKEASSVTTDQKMIASHILPNLGHVKIETLTSRDINLWLNVLRFTKKLSPKYTNNCLGLLRKMLNDALTWQFVRNNPANGVKPLKLNPLQFQFWSKEEIKKFLCYLEDHLPDLLSVFAIALYTGMRKGEIRGLKWDCVDLRMRQITVRRSYCDHVKALKENTKGNRIRYVPINPALRNVLIGLQNKSKGDFVVTDFSFHHCYRRMKSLAQKSGVKRIRFHDLRHTFASHFMMAGGTIFDLQKILGHSTIAMTERYSHMSPNHLAGKTDIIDFSTPKLAEVIPLRTNF